MSRLEEIKEHVQGLMDLITGVDGNGVANLQVIYNDMIWLIERVQELESEKESLMMSHDIDKRTNRFIEKRIRKSEDENDILGHSINDVSATGGFMIKQLKKANARYLELFKKLSHMLVDINMDHQTIINELTSICKEV